MNPNHTTMLDDLSEPIAPESMKKIAQPFHLRPHICSQIVDEHRGSLQGSSSTEVGRRFVAEIPIATPQ